MLGCRHLPCVCNCQGHTQGAACKRSLCSGELEGGAGRSPKEGGLSTGQAREGLAVHTLWPHLQGPCKHPRAWPFVAQDEYMRGDLRPALHAGPAAGHGTPVFWEAAGACDFPRVPGKGHVRACVMEGGLCSARAQVNTALRITECSSWKEA